MTSTALPLMLHGRYSRKEIYATVGVRFSQQNRNLLYGLSPQCRDGGYFIFVTLDKTALDPLHDYDDQVYADKLVWVTRRDRDESHNNYVRLREPDCRVSLFVRTNPSEKFVYAGELEYTGWHEQFRDPRTSKVQQRYIWKLHTPVPDRLLQELTLGIGRKPRRVPKRGPRIASPRKRRPASFDEYKKAFEYAIGSTVRQVTRPTSTTRCG